MLTQLLTAVQYILCDLSAPGVQWFCGTETSALSPFFCSSSLGPPVRRRYFSKLFCAHPEPTPAAAAVCDLCFSLIPLLGTVGLTIESPGRGGERALLFLAGPTLATNLLSTGLIAWKARCALLAASDPRQLSLTILTMLLA
jgi:hypothetical protein